MSSTAPSALAARLINEVAALMPEFMRDPIDAEMSSGNTALCIIDSAGGIHGQVFGNVKKRGRYVFSNATRKVLQVWLTGYATGRFEELVFAGKLDEHEFGLQKPDFIGWDGGVPLFCEDGSLMAAAFSGFRGEKDVEIIERAASKVPGLRLKRD